MAADVSFGILDVKLEAIQMILDEIAEGVPWLNDSQRAALDSLSATLFELLGQLVGREQDAREALMDAATEWLRENGYYSADALADRQLQGAFESHKMRLLDLPGERGDDA